MEKKVLVFKLFTGGNLICEVENTYHESSIFPVKDRDYGEEVIRYDMKKSNPIKVANPLLVQFTTNENGKEIFVFSDLKFYKEDTVEMEHSGYIFKGEPTDQLLKDYRIVLEKIKLEKSPIIQPKLSIVRGPDDVA